MFRCKLHEIMVQSKCWFFPYKGEWLNELEMTDGSLVPSRNHVERNALLFNLSFNLKRSRNTNILFPILNLSIDRHNFDRTFHYYVVQTKSKRFFSRQTNNLDLYNNFFFCLNSIPVSLVHVHVHNVKYILFYLYTFHFNKHSISIHTFVVLLCIPYLYLHVAIYLKCFKLNDVWI